MMQQGSFRYAKLKKFSSKTGCSIMPGTRCQQFPAGFHLNVFIEGTTVARYCWVEGHRDDDGHWHEGHYTKSEKAFIDQTCFQLLQKPNEGGGEPTEIASWSCPGELEGGDITTENALFSTLQEGGWASSKLRVQTKEFWDPCLSLVISYLTSKEYCPKELKGDFSKTFSSVHKSNCRGASPPAAESCPARHRRDPCSTAWRCGPLSLVSANTAAFSPRRT